MRFLPKNAAIIATLLCLAIVLLYECMKPMKLCDQAVTFSVFNKSRVKPQDHSLGILEQNLHSLYNDVQTFVLFVGRGRSGHSLVGAILDAHPEILIAHEFDVIGEWDDYKKKRSVRPLKLPLFFHLHSISRKEAMFGTRSCSSICERVYCYHVPGQWQGTYKNTIKVIGAKKGGATATHLGKNLTVLEEMQEALQVPVKFIHVIRNPFDNIATQLLRAFVGRNFAPNGKLKVPLNNSIALDAHLSEYFHQMETIQRLHLQGKYEILDIYSDEIISNPQQNIKKLCNFLGVTTDQDYIEASSKIIYYKPSVTRHFVVWTSEQKARVITEMKKYQCLRKFSFES